jgi:predicted Zn-dependent protease
LILIGIGIVFLTAAGFSATYLYHSAKIWRAHWLVKQALALPPGEGTAEAESKLIAAYHLAPDDLQVLRACARWQTAAGDVHALGFYRLLLSQPQFTKEDQRDALRACLLFGNLSGARELASAIIVESPEPEDYALEAQVFWKEGSLDQAIAIMRNAVALAPQDRAHQFLLAQMLISGTSLKDHEEAIQSLENLSVGKDEVGLKALVILSGITNLDAATQRSLLDQLRSYPLVEDQGRFAEWNLEKRLGLRDPETIGREVIDFFKNTELTRKSTAARWLYIQNQPELAMELASPPDTLSNQDLLLVRFDSLAYLKRWADLKTELANPEIPLSQPMIFLYRARADRELGDAVASHANWDRARLAAKLDYSALSNLAAYAVKLGAYDEAKLTLAQMTQFPQKGREAFGPLLEIEAQHGSTAEVLETLKQMMDAFPYQPEPKNDWAYLNLLMNTNVNEASKIAQDLVTSHPEMLAYRSTLALAYLRRNDFPGAAKVYDGLQIDWGSAPTSWAMVDAVVLAANGQKAPSQDLARTINRSQLRAEELTLFDAYFPERKAETVSPGAATH